MHNRAIPKRKREGAALEQPAPRDEDWEQWDREFEEDVKAGKLDVLAAEALEAKSKGELKAL